MDRHLLFHQEVTVELITDLERLVTLNEISNEVDLLNLVCVELFLENLSSTLALFELSTKLDATQLCVACHILRCRAFNQGNESLTFIIKLLTYGARVFAQTSPRAL